MTHIGKTLKNEDVLRVGNLLKGSVTKNGSRSILFEVLNLKKEYAKQIEYGLRLGALLTARFVWQSAGYKMEGIDRTIEHLMWQVYQESEKSFFGVYEDYMKMQTKAENAFAAKKHINIIGRIDEIARITADKMQENRLIVTPEKISRHIARVYRPLYEIYEHEIAGSEDEEHIYEFLVRLCNERQPYLKTLMTRMIQLPKKDVAGKRKAYVYAVGQYMFAVENDFYRVFFSREGESYTAFRKMTKEPERTGYDIKAKDIYRAGEIYAMYCMSVRRRPAGPYECADLNSFQKNIINITYEEVIK